MTRQCLLDLLPVELLHTLFTYFWAHEILFTFYNVTDYIDAVLLSYASYRLDFTGTQKLDFDFICDHILPDQVISLTLSDNNDTFGLSEIFLSRFHIEQFTQLRSLTLIQIEIESLKIIFPNLYKLHQLRSLSFDIETIRHKYPAWYNDHSHESQRFKYFLIQTYNKVFPQLHYISCHSSNDLVSIPLPHLRQLKLLNFSDDDLEKRFQNSLYLKSLDLTLNLNTQDWDFIFAKNQLIRLNLKLRSMIKKKRIFLIHKNLYLFYRPIYIIL